MTAPGQRQRRGPKPTLSREILVEAALDLVDNDGLGALNLRTLAGRMGISAMTT
jgi:DNA-binding transcriptional regulator YbjK